MVDGQNAKVLQDVAEAHRAATQPDLRVAPSVTEPPLDTETSTAAASTAPIDAPPAAVPPVVEPVAKAPAGRRGSAAAQ